MPPALIESSSLVAFWSPCHAPLEVVAPEGAEITQVEAAVRHHGVGPGSRLTALGRIGRREPPLLAVRLGGRLHERNLAVLAVEIEVTVRGAEGTRTHRAVFPLQGAGAEFDAEQHRVRRAVEVVADPDRAAERGGHLRR